MKVGQKTVAGALRRLGSLPSKLDRYALLISVLGLAVLIVIELFDSFGLDTASDRAIAQAAATWSGPFYGRGEDGQREGQDAILLALIDEGSLQELNTDGFPIPYAGQAQIVRNLAEHRPMAIFLDFHYSRPRVADVENYEFAVLTGEIPQPSAGVAELDAAIEEAEALGIKVVLGPVSDHPLLAPLADHTQVDVELPVDGYYEHIFEYKGGSGTDKTRVFGSGPLPAAMELFKLYCEQKNSADHCMTKLRGLHDETFYMQWGLGSSDRQLSRVPQDLRARCATTANPWSSLFELLGRGFTRGLQKKISDTNLASRCTYHDAVPVSSILSGNDTGNPIGESINGRIVMVGGDTRSSGDRWPAPFYNEVPGVAIHAMALDNLIEYDGDVPLVPIEVLGMDGNDLLQIATVASLLIFFLWISRNSRLALLRKYEDGTVKPRRIAIGIVLVTIVTATIVFWVVATYMRWPLQFILLNLAAPAGLTAMGLLLIGRMSKGRIVGEDDDKTIGE